MLNIQKTCLGFIVNYYCKTNSQKFNKLVCNVYDKENNVLHIRTLKQALNQGLILKKVHRVNEFNKESWLKP